MVRVRIPSLLRGIFHTQPIEEGEASSVTQMVSRLDERYLGIGDCRLGPDGAARRYVNVLVDGEQVRWEGRATTLLEDPAEVWIVPGIAGGGFCRAETDMPEGMIRNLRLSAPTLIEVHA